MGLTQNVTWWVDLFFDTVEIIPHTYKGEDFDQVWFMTSGGEGHANFYFYKDCDYAILSSLSVEQEHRNKGIGTALQEERERVVRDVYGFTEVWLWCDRDNWQRQWYERRGYAYESDRDEEEGSIWMKKNLQ